MGCCPVSEIIISIHALRVEGDLYIVAFIAEKSDFYPRPPGGGRPMRCSVSLRRFYFYPRPPGGGRPSWTKCKTRQKDFYPRPPGGGRQCSPVFFRFPRRYFYPRPPGGGRPASTAFKPSAPYFYPRPPGGGRRLGIYHRCPALPYFYPRPPGGGRRGWRIPVRVAERFLSTPSGWRATLKSITLSRTTTGFLSTPSGWRATSGYDDGRRNP